MSRKAGDAVEKTGSPRQEDEDLILLTFAEVAKILRFRPGAFSSWLAENSPAARTFKAVPCVTRGRGKLWRKSDIRRYVETQVRVA